MSNLPSKRWYIVASQETRRKAKIVAADEGLSIGDWISEIISNKYEKFVKKMATAPPKEEV